MRIVEETYLPGNSVSIVARRYGIAGNQLFTWRRLMAQGAFTAAGAGEEVVQRLEPSMNQTCSGVERKTEVPPSLPSVPKRRH